MMFDVYARMGSMKLRLGRYARSNLHEPIISSITRGWGVEIVKVPIKEAELS